MPDAPPSPRLGWWLSSEEHDPRDLVVHAVAAEAAGFPTAMISDHLRPWTRRQGNSSHVWTVLGAIAAATDTLQVGTGVTAMVQRNSPIVVAHAAATAAVMFEDRFFLGVGTGERLNEQPFGGRWPRPGERRDTLREAVEVIRRLLSGETVNHRGGWWAVENLDVATRPGKPPPIFVAASGPRSAKLAAEIGDGLIGVAPDARLVDVFRSGPAGHAASCVAQIHVSIASTRDAAIDNAWTWWPQAVVPPSIMTELAKPGDFEAVAEAVGRDAIERAVLCVTEPGPIIDAIDRHVAAGYDTVYLHQIGPEQDRLEHMARQEMLPHYAAPAR
jgi:G6PDH family F420-dependent oxidoreductase